MQQKYWGQNQKNGRLAAAAPCQHPDRLHVTNIAVKRIRLQFLFSKQSSVQQTILPPSVLRTQTTHATTGQS